MALISNLITTYELKLKLERVDELLVDMEMNALRVENLLRKMNDYN